MAELYRCIEDGGSISEVERLIDSGEDVNYKNVDEYNFSILHKFCLSYEKQMGAETLKILNLLLEKGADVDAVDKIGWTPLMVLVSEGFPLDHVDLLISKGANVNQVTNYGYTAVHCITDMGKTKRGSYSLSVLNLLIDNGALLDCEDENGMTPLVWLVLDGFPPDHIEILLKKGADVTHKDPIGRKYPVLHACTQNPDSPDNVAITRMLCEYGSEIHWRSEQARDIVLHYLNGTEKDVVCEIIFKFSLLRDDTVLNAYCDISVGEVNKLRKFVDTALKDLAEMRASRLNNQVTVHDFMVEVDQRKLGGYFRLWDVDDRESANLETRFPIYSDIISWKLEIAGRWAETLGKLDAISSMSVVNGPDDEEEVELNHDCVEHIARFLSDDDLEKFVSACTIND